MNVASAVDALQQSKKLAAQVENAERVQMAPSDFGQDVRQRRTELRRDVEVAAACIVVALRQSGATLLRQEITVLIACQLP